MRRRNFIKIVVGSALTLPSASAARAQQRERVRRVAVLMVNAEADSDGHVRVNAFRQGLEKLGWSEGRNLQLDLRWGAGSPELARRHAADLVASRPDIILANGTPAVAALQSVTRTIPIVFAVVTDPVGAGFVRSLSHPGGNITGFSTFEPAMGNKWVELLKEVVPGMQRIACISDPNFRGFSGVQREIEIVAPQFGIGVSTLVFRETSDDLEGSVAHFAEQARGGLIVFPTAINNVERNRIFTLAARHRLPAIYPFRHHALSGGLIAYGFDTPNLFLRSADYVDRILKGAKPSDLPVQAPTKFDLVINMKTAKALDLAIAPTLLARADEVIE
jgi:putative tryptophan/tyrosine transport system substrate-binding protein